MSLRTVKHPGFGETELARLMKPCQNIQDSLRVSTMSLYASGVVAESDLACFERGVMRPKRAGLPSASEEEQDRMPSEIFRAGENERSREKHARSGSVSQNDTNLYQMAEMLQTAYKLQPCVNGQRLGRGEDPPGVFHGFIQFLNKRYGYRQDNFHGRDIPFI